MKADIELDLVHDGQDWVVSNDTLKAKGADLHALDDDLRCVLRQDGVFPPGSRVTVFMGFDFDTIPTWLRQYHNHYFNRLVTLKI